MLRCLPCVCQSLPSFLSSLLGQELVAAGAATELSAYLDESFGNQQRIDYGTGQITDTCTHHIPLCDLPTTHDTPTSPAHPPLPFPSPLLPPRQATS